jgi:hypothetical protein
MSKWLSSRRHVAVAVALERVWSQPIGEAQSKQGCGIRGSADAFRLHVV